MTGAAVFVSNNAGFRSAFTVSESSLESMLSTVALAVFVTEPASRSACVIVYEAVQVTEAPGARSPDGHVTVALSSLTDAGPASVTLPVFVTSYEYEITSPTSSYVDGEAVLSSSTVRD